MTAGELLFEGEFDFNIPDLKPVIAYAVDGGAGALKVSQASASGSYENSWRLSLSESTPIDLQVTFGAGPPSAGIPPFGPAHCRGDGKCLVAKWLPKEGREVGSPFGV